MENKTLLLATHNQGKVREFNTLLEPLGYKAIEADSLGIDMEKVEETSETFRGNSLIKAVYAYQQSKGEFPVLADDSGLCVWGLNGFPGVHSSRFSVDGDTSYLTKQNAILKMLEGKKDRSASFFCVLTFITKEGEPFQFVGEAKGEITDKILDSGKGFGYDPIFFSPALKKTFGQATTQEKDAVSHRGKATSAFLAFFSKIIKK